MKPIRTTTLPKDEGSVNLKDSPIGREQIDSMLNRIVDSVFLDITFLYEQVLPGFLYGLA